MPPPEGVGLYGLKSCRKKDRLTLKQVLERLDNGRSTRIFMRLEGTELVGWMHRTETKAASHVPRSDRDEGGYWDKFSDRGLLDFTYRRLMERAGRGDPGKDLSRWDLP